MLVHVVTNTAEQSLSSVFAAAQQFHDGDVLQTTKSLETRLNGLNLRLCRKK